MQSISVEVHTQVGGTSICKKDFFFWGAIGSEENYVENYFDPFDS